MIRKSAFILLTGMIFFFATAFSLAAIDQKKTTAMRLKVKPDLRIAGIQVERVGFNADGAHRVRIRVTVVNSAAAAVCAGPFMVVATKNDQHSEWYVFINRQSVARLCADPSRARMATATLDFEDTVPPDEQRRYQAKVDDLGQVDEAREDNNTRLSDIYVAKSYCSGVDLALTSVEIVRGTGGNVYIRAHGLNRCTGECAASVKFSIEVAEPTTDELGVEQAVAVNIAGLQEYETSGMLGVYSRSDRNVTYRVRIDTGSPACADANPGNNECLVAFGAAETRKTQNCH